MQEKYLFALGKKNYFRGVGFLRKKTGATHPLVANEAQIKVTEAAPSWLARHSYGE